jgi:hypothetical protein
LEHEKNLEKKNRLEHENSAEFLSDLENKYGEEHENGTKIELISY